MLTRRSLVVGAMAAAISPVSARASAPITLLTFPSPTNLPVWIAEEQGFFAAEGLALAIGRARGSAQAALDLYAGQCQILSTALDNLVAYVEGQSEVRFGGPLDLTAIATAPAGFNSLVARPEIADFRALRGKTVAVDSPASGYSLALYAMLARRGLRQGRDYQVLAAGAARLGALESGQAAATMIEAPLDVLAAKAGYRVLATLADEIGPYAGAFLVRRRWAEAAQAEVAGFLRAIRTATDYLRTHRAQSTAVLRERLVPIIGKRMAELGDADFDRLYDRLTGPGGFGRDAATERRAVANVLRIRQAFGQPRRRIGPPGKYIDPAWARAAARG